MKKSMPIGSVAEQVAEYLYNLSIPEQAEILANNFGVEVEDTGDGVLWEGELISDSKFDQNLMEIIENMGYDAVIELWENYTNAICELDENNNVVWDDDDEFKTFNEAPYGDD